MPWDSVAGEQTQAQSLIQKLHRLGFLKHNPAHKTYQIEPYLRPHLAALAQQQPDALYSPSLLGWSKACLQICAVATAVYSAHAQVCFTECLGSIVQCPGMHHSMPGLNCAT